MQSLVVPRRVEQQTVNSEDTLKPSFVKTKRNHFNEIVCVLARIFLNIPALSFLVGYIFYNTHYNVYHYARQQSQLFGFAVSWLSGVAAHQWITNRSPLLFTRV